MPSRQRRVHPPRPRLGSVTESHEERDDGLAQATCASRRSRCRVSVGERSPTRCEGVTMEAEPRLHFVNIDDVPWTEVIAQLHGERRVSVHEKFLEWNAKRMVVLGRYDPHVVIDRHGHASDHLVYVLDGELLVGERPCPPGTLIVLELGATFGPLVAGG